MTYQGYSLSFTTSSLRKQETLKLAEAYLYYRDWRVVREQAIRDNTLQQRTTSSSKKLVQELLSRLRNLSDDELMYLVTCPESEKSILLWISICRRYSFIRDFAVEVFLEHFRTLNYSLGYADFEVFFSSKVGIYSGLDTISNSTRRKVCQVIFRMLREAGLLSRDNMITPALPANETLKLLKTHELELIGILKSHSSPHEAAS